MRLWQKQLQHLSSKLNTHIFKRHLTIIMGAICGDSSWYAAYLISKSQHGRELKPSWFDNMYSVGMYVILPAAGVIRASSVASPPQLSVWPQWAAGQTSTALFTCRRPQDASLHFLPSVGERSNRNNTIAALWRLLILSATSAHFDSSFLHNGTCMSIHVIIIYTWTMLDCRSQLCSAIKKYLINQTRARQDVGKSQL